MAVQSENERNKAVVAALALVPAVTIARHGLGVHLMSNMTLGRGSPMSE
jgi:hypothetical protein